MNRSAQYLSFLLPALLIMGLSPITLAQPNWSPLFNGKDLTGWKKLNGSARYHVQDGAIVGTAVADSGNTFLVTEKDYSDFILELEVKVDPPLNSGIQIRSHSRPDYRQGRVHGYQVEIDPTPRAWSGGIYDEARRGWLYNLTRNPACRRAFRNDDWNRYRIEALGTTLRTWVNGVACSNLVDRMTASGFIGLQVHGVGEDSGMVGKTVRWRDIRIRTDRFGPVRMPYGEEEIPEVNHIPNHLTDKQKAEGWRLLWDGKTTRGWRGAKLDGFPKKGWRIRGGVLTVLPSGGGESAHGGDIITLETFSDFELEVDFRISAGANSGIKYFVDPELNQGQGSAIGLEFQILDDQRHPDASKGLDSNRTLGSLYDLIPARNLSEPGRVAKRFNGIGQWNRARILVRGARVEHWLNDVKLVEYERGTQLFRALVAHSKYRIWPDFGEAERGPILLQDHGDEVSFRSIKVRGR